LIQRHTGTKLLLAVVLSLCATTAFAKNEDGLDPQARADHVVVHKKDHTLTLFNNGKALKIYKVAWVGM
jgi:hypothetical protein